MGAVQQLMMAHKAAAGGAIVYDTFTGSNGTLISAHTAETGGAWTAEGGDDSFLHTNRAVGAGTTHRFYNAATPPSADYDVEATLYFLTTGSTFKAGVRGRWNTATTDYYMVRYNGANGDLELVRVLAGTEAVLGSYTTTPSASSSHTVRLKMTGTSIEGFYDGVSRLGPVTDSNVTAANKVGFTITNGGDTTGYALDTFWAGANGGTVGP